jgi:hypothetical protein
MKPSKCPPLRPKTKQFARITDATCEYLGKQRPMVVEMDTESGEILVRPYGCKKGRVFNLAELLELGTAIKTRATVEINGEKKSVIVQVDVEKSELYVRLHRNRKAKRYPLSDLVEWGAQLALPLS